MITKHAMESITESKLRQIAATERPNSVSIYMPTHRKGHETKEDPLRLKVLLNQAEKSLTLQGMRAPDARSMLDTARGLIHDGRFWSYQADGLALLITPSSTASYRLPRRFDEVCYVSNRFLLTPLVPVVNLDGEFLILAISPKRVRLFAGSRDSIDELKIAGLPKDFDELGKYIDTERTLQFHTRAAPTGEATSNRAAVFHGQGEGTDDALWKKQLGEFCQMIQRSLKPILGKRQTPLVLAADQSLVAIYQEGNPYPHTLEQAVKGNPDERSENELHDAAWQIVREEIQRDRRHVLSVYEQAAANGQGSNAIDEILPAAFDGRIDSLLIAEFCHIWGAYDRAARKAIVHRQRQEGDEDLVNLAAITTLLKGGDINAYDGNDMPGRNPIAAIYRY
jgi:hypothetical protein